MAKVSGKVKNRFLCTNTSSGGLFEFNENGEIVWSIPTNTCGLFDIWQLDDGSILHCFYAGGDSGARIIDRNGDVKTIYKRAVDNEIFSCQPIEDGKILVGELREKRLVEVNRKGEIVKIIPFEYNEENEHETMRSMRKLPDGTYMMVSPGMKKIVFFDDKGKVYKSFDTHNDTFGAAFRDNGNLVYGCMSGIYELDKDGKEVWSFTNDDNPDLGICWILAVYIKENGNIVANNWLGHGKEGMGVPIFEVTPDKKVVWTCDCREEVGTLGNFYILEDRKCEDISRMVKK